jgi:two-component system heavy metal sensor histidine kinase CusS
MSSKNEVKAPQSWSLALRMTVWYTASAFALLLVATGYLYWALASHLDREDDQFLADRVRRLRQTVARPDFDATTLRREVEQPESPYWRFRVVVARLPRFDAETPGTASEIPRDTASLDADEDTFDHHSASGEYYRVRSYRSPEGDVEIVAAMNRRHDSELLEDYRRHLSYVLGLGLLGCAAIGYWVARSGLRPVRAITDTASRIDPVNFGERIDTAGLPAELLVLADSFNAMLDRLERSFDRLGRFSADIAHELRTPVNNLRGEVEVALGKPRTPDEYRDVLTSNLEECGRLARLIESLLFLARAENPKMQIVKDRVDVGGELATVCEYYEAAAGEKGVKLTVAVAGRVHADLNRTLFQRAVGNLIENALAHTPAGGIVTMTAGANETSAMVEVIDTGGGIPAAHLPHVFERFYRADPVRSSTGGNLGLGLAIVKSIVELHGGNIEIASGEGGTRATMTFFHAG